MLQPFDEYDEEDYRQAVIPYGQRNDHECGYVYLFKAPGFHGIFPGLWLSRCKIGLSRNPNARASRIESNQPGHDIEILHTVYVEDMADVEAKLHARFASKNVHLNRSREYFDLMPWDIAYAKLLMNFYADLYWMSFKRAGIAIISAFFLGAAISAALTISIKNPACEAGIEQIKE